LKMKPEGPQMAKKEKKFMKKTAAALMCVCLMVSSAFAVDLVNRDDKIYDVKIHRGAVTTSSTISGNMTQVNICPDCEIEVEGVGKITASGSEKVVIHNGSLAKE